jgi:hypothetical protein
MSNCCLKNLGCLQIPVSEISVAGQAGATGAAGAPGAAGATGAPGATGADGTTRLYSFVGNDTSATTSSFVTLETYTLPANTLTTNGDSVLIQATHSQTTSAALPNIAQRRITFDSISTTVVGGLEPVDWTLASGASRYLTSVEIIRTGATTATCRVFCQVFTNGDNPLRYENNLTGLDFTTTNDIDFDVFQFAASQSALRTLTIDKISA